MSQRPTREHGVNPTLVMPFGKKLHSLFSSEASHSRCVIVKKAHSLIVDMQVAYWHKTLIISYANRYYTDCCVPLERHLVLTEVLCFFLVH